MSSLMPEAGAATLDYENPWPGLASYDEAACQYFNGRNAEIAELTRRVVDEPLTVLFGRSGLGKSSLLKAGAFPQLRELGFIPIYIRLQFHKDQLELTAQVRAYFEQELCEQRIEYPNWSPDESLWQLLHRSEFELWTQQNRLVRPVFVFDQFEEIFTLGRQVPDAVERFRTELADLIENRIPASLSPHLEAIGTDGAQLDLHAARCKVVISLREDFLADLEGWRAAMPSLRHNRMRLLPMCAETAKQAICNERTHHLVDETRATEIVAFLSGQSAAVLGSASASAGGASESGDIDPALLSLFCARVNERRKKEHKAKIDEALVAGARQTVVVDFYRDCMKDQPTSARRFIEEELITEHGFRNNFAVEDALQDNRLSCDQLRTLVNRRLLRRSHFLGTERIELTHDVLTKAIAEDRNRGRRLRRVRRAGGYAVALLLGISAIGFFSVQGLQSKAAGARARSQELAAISRRELERNPELATLLGRAALDKADTLGAREALIQSARYAWPSAVLEGVSQLGGTPSAVAVSIDGRHLAVIARNGAESFVSLWDVQDPTTREPKRLWLTSVAGEAQSLVFARDKSRIAVAGSLGVELLETKFGERQFMLSESGPANALAFGSNGQLLWSTKHHLHVWSETPTRKEPETIDVSGVQEIGFHNGRILVRRILPNQSVSLSLVEPEQDGTWRTTPIPIECGGVASASIGGSRYAAVVPLASCAFTVETGGIRVPDTEFGLADARQGVGTTDVVWARVGTAHVKLIGAGEMLVVGPKTAWQWSTRLKGVTLSEDRQLVDHISLSASGVRLAVIAAGDEHDRQVIVHYLEQRLFLAEIRKGAVAVSTSGDWIALERRPTWRSTTTTLAMFQRTSDSTFLPAGEALVKSLPNSINAAGRTIIVGRQQADKTFVVEGFAIDKPDAPSWSEQGMLVAILGEEQRFALISPESGTGAHRVVDIAGGKVAYQWSSADAVRAHAELGLVAVPQPSAMADTLDVTVLRAADGVMTEHATIRGVPRTQWELLQFSRDGSTLEGAAGAWGPQGKVSNDAGSKRPERRATTMLSPAGRYEIESAERGGSTSKGLGVRDRASGTTLNVTPMTQRQGFRFSNDDRWLVFWDDLGVEVLDLEQKRHVGMLHIANVQSAAFEGSGRILRLGLSQHSMLVPLELEMTKAMARALVTRPLDACAYMGQDCPLTAAARAGPVARLWAHIGAILS